MKSISARTEIRRVGKPPLRVPADRAFDLQTVLVLSGSPRVSFHTEVSAVEPHLKIELLESLALNFVLMKLKSVISVRHKGRLRQSQADRVSVLIEILRASDIASIFALRLVERDA